MIHADIVGVFGKFPPLMRLRVDRGLLEALAFLLGIRPTVVFPSGRWTLFPPWRILRPEIIRPEETWRKANISLDLLTKYFSRSVFPSELVGDFIAGKRGWKKFRIIAFKIAFAGIFLFPTSAGRIDLGVIPLLFSEGRSIIPAILCETVRSLSYCRRRGEGVPMFCIQLLQLWFCSHLQHFYRLQTPHHFERYTVRQTVNAALPFTGNSRDWALYLLDLPLSEWSWKVTWGPAVWMPWTHCALFDGVPLPGVWGCTGYYPSLALRQFGGVQYPPRLGDLDAVTFDYIPGEDMWRLLFRIEDIWGGRLSEMVLIEGGLHGDSSVTPDFVEWREGWSPSFTLRPTVRPGASYSSVSRSLRASAPTGHLRERSLRLVWSLCGATLHHNSVAVANLRRDLEVQRGNVSTLRTMNDFIREQLEISEAAKDHMEETLTETQGQLETEQALVDPSTGRPHDIVALRRALDESEVALTSARTSIGAMRVQISVLQGDNGVLQTEVDLVHDALESNASWLNQEGFPVVTALHQINQVMDSLGARARAVLEEHDEGDPALSTALGRFCRETCIRLGH
uniref:DUF7745 domain-containing protein n=1 Tax=Fagus sylvatica TaxID=28930 RepID=A0A2N9JBR7_FAGSY